MVFAFAGLSTIKRFLGMFNGLGPHLSVYSPIGEERPGFKFKNQLLELSISSFV